MLIIVTCIFLLSHKIELGLAVQQLYISIQLKNNNYFFFKCLRCMKKQSPFISEFAFILIDFYKKSLNFFYKKVIKFIFVLMLALFAKFVSFNWIIGSHGLTFSLSSMMAPVIGNQFGISFVALFFFTPKIFYAKSIVLFLLHRLPLFFASHAFKKPTFFVSVIIPAVCMLLFVSSEVGSIAWCYSLYWIIPIALYFLRSSVISRALTASFVSHCVGSVIWLYYCAEIAPAIWIALIPVVAVERLLIAAGIIVFDKAVSVLKEAPKRFSSVTFAMWRAL